AIDLGEKARADGADFAQLARTHSDAPDASSGGQLPPFTRTDDVDQLTKSAAFRLQPGQISGVLATPKGFMIIKRLQ
ncbi:MAG: peptidyl-prolyl cis-trans isomerase, partial [Polyangiaceae bacterium]|nr:peptidyl-prolyl cis-trans isomerase [Polyangiaceae bacterium]